MNLSVARTDTSVIGRWWWTVDRWTLAALILLVAYGAVLTLAASPPAAARINLDTFHFVRQQMLLLPVAIGMMFIISLLPPRWIKRLAVLMLVGALAMTLIATFFGAEIKGARRWIALGGFSLQPSEFLKPAFAVFAAWMFAMGRQEKSFPGGIIATLGMVAVIGVLALQPDIGMSGVIGAIWFALLFMSGIPMVLIVGFFLLMAGSVFAAYLTLPHVAQRFNLFLDPKSGDTYQIDRSVNAFMNGGLFGRGPGEGVVKNQLPDAHSDFIFAVAGEEFGLLVCLIIVATYGFIVLRGFLRLLGETNLFVLYAVTGLLTAFGLQTVINLASTLRLMPTKGMTLPFISYGGSSLLALAIGMGMMLALTRKRPGGTL